jgi:hypothetical protein
MDDPADPGCPGVKKSPDLGNEFPRPQQGMAACLHKMALIHVCGPLFSSLLRFLYLAIRNPVPQCLPGCEKQVLNPEDNLTHNSTTGFLLSNRIRQGTNYQLIYNQLIGSLCGRQGTHSGHLVQILVLFG